MASFQARGRDPLLDQTTQAVLERRGKELVGAGLVVLALMLTATLASYSPDDPGWLAVTDAPAQNLMGRAGASIASILSVFVGLGAWGIVAALAIWGGRFILHRGEERFVGRMLFAPIGVALISAYAASLVPPTDWPHAFGLGGLFGDTVMGALLSFSPIAPGVALKLIAFAMALSSLAMGLFVLGFERAELSALARGTGLALALGYDRALHLAGSGAQEAAARLREARQRKAEQAAVPPVAEPAFDAAPRPGLLGRIRRAAPLPEPDLAADLEPELIETAPDWDTAPEAPSQDRIRARIADAVRARAAAPQQPAPDALAEPAGAPRQMPILRAPLPDRDPVFGWDDMDADDEGDLDAIAGLRAPAQQGADLRTPVAGFSDSPRAEFDSRSAQAADDIPARPSVLAAVARRLARGAAPVEVAPSLRIEPVLQAQPRFMPGARNLPEPTPFVAIDDSAEAAAAETMSPAPMPPETAALDPEDDDLRNVFAVPDDSAAPAPRPRPLLRATTPDPTPRRVVHNAAKRAAAPSRAAQAEAQPRLALDPEPAAAAAYEAPPLNLLTNPASIARHQLSDEALEENARMLESVLDDYGVKGEIVSVRPGPVVTMYELEPAPGLKASRVIGLADDIARSMSALSARVSTVPGRSVIGIELPNAQREKVVLREILSARDFGDSNMRLPLALGKDIAGEPIVANLAKMPHLLIAGTTGSGKSVAINTMILSLLYKLSPDECRLIMIDPKMLELSVYDGIPHLLSPVVTDPKKAVVALKWVVAEMEERYRKMSKMGVRNIEGYNGRVREALSRGEMFKRTVQTGFDEETGDPIFETEEIQPKTLPYIVVIVDEMADLMMVAGKEIEACIQRLAQMARASGIHLIMATQRPSVDVITGTIKANFPTRISFQVTSKIDSRTILGEMGAEQLLGMGDMLYMGTGSRITRIHGPFVSDEEVEEIVNHLKSFGPPEYLSGVLEGPEEEQAQEIDAVLGLGGNTNGDEALYDQAVAIVARDRKCSTSYIQRKLGIGYNKAARLVEQMEDQGVVSPANHVGKREVLIPEA
ncbi:DNA translocase FtsK [Phaeovulum vinaykumarii]|uniref:DNA translocase FtsK n=1 Tax=Phaeovulum vinaykumarii TaxID=407234 RepID=A0A1N7KPS9_9RHOB|nr:DNA translocase FtsK [Phaeovulum vinaykumarii]SIS63613.1 DNA translocase FtsK [Phaeovulum vinaykumarii]SOC01864.1 DNA translocase FtsK [Phaeovulum vinaykumarii]